jgi:hypothetical protein
MGRARAEVWVGGSEVLTIGLRRGRRGNAMLPAEHPESESPAGSFLDITGWNLLHLQ